MFPGIQSILVKKDILLLGGSTWCRYFNHRPSLLVQCCPRTGLVDPSWHRHERIPRLAAFLQEDLGRLMIGRADPDRVHGAITMTPP